MHFLRTFLQLVLTPLVRIFWHFPPRLNRVFLSVSCRFPVWPQLREAEPHDPETEPSDSAQPCSPARTSGCPPWPDLHSDGSNTRSAWPDNSSDGPKCGRSSCTSRFPTCTRWNAAESRHPVLWPPASALPPWRKVRQHNRWSMFRLNGALCQSLFCRLTWWPHKVWQHLFMCICLLCFGEAKASSHPCGQKSFFFPALFQEGAQVHRRTPGLLSSRSGSQAGLCFVA